MIKIYTAKEAKAAADAFYGPLAQIFGYIEENSKNGLYVVQAIGVDLSSKQIEVLTKCGYDVEQTVNEDDKIVYVISWQ